jgi:hypothetical protein
VTQDAKKKSFGRALNTAKNKKLIAGDFIDGKQLIWFVRACDEG